MNFRILSLVKQVMMAVVLIISIGSIAEARNCKKGKPCGNSCISQNDVCHKEATTSKSVAPEVAPPPTVPQASEKTTDAAKDTSKLSKHCKKGKPCGNSCIAQDAVCQQK